MARNCLKYQIICWFLKVQNVPFKYLSKLKKWVMGLWIYPSHSLLNLFIYWSYKVCGLMMTHTSFCWCLFFSLTLLSPWCLPTPRGIVSISMYIRIYMCKYTYAPLSSPPSSTGRFVLVCSSFQFSGLHTCTCIRHTLAFTHGNMLLLSFWVWTTQHNFISHLSIYFQGV